MADQKISHEYVKGKPLSDQIGLFFGDSCIIPAKTQADFFCEGMTKGIESAINVSGVDRKSFQFQCKTKSAPPSKIPKELANTQDPQILEIFQDQYITFVKVDPETQSIEESDPFLAQIKDGKIEGRQCFIPREVIAEKFCIGFNEGIDHFFRYSKLDREKYRKGCKLEKGIPELNTKDQILYGFSRIVD